MRDIQREIQENLDAIETKYDVKILHITEKRPGYRIGPMEKSGVWETARRSAC